MGLYPERLVRQSTSRCAGFPHIRDIPRMWVGVIPLMGRRGMNVRDFGEAQGLRIDIKYHEIP
ncbi:ORF3 in transposon ISC1904 [Saccharolobus solfataricus]|uniref:ORF3 in transposon ISC1904 n=1 Tax=Saccharolobus solfataricus TaxID=2287 RepID=A0A0E3KCJ8_SACSO|nr:ORF3 in transposon ISC1904 [Saccharolobus solfataricus]